jgi:hypothetical protein
MLRRLNAGSVDRDVPIVEILVEEPVRGHQGRPPYAEQIAPLHQLDAHKRYDRSLTFTVSQEAASVAAHVLMPARRWWITG